MMRTNSSLKKKALSLLELGLSFLWQSISQNFRRWAPCILCRRNMS